MKKSIYLFPVVFFSVSLVELELSANDSLCYRHYSLMSSCEVVQINDSAQQDTINMEELQKMLDLQQIKAMEAAEKLRTDTIRHLKNTQEKELRE